MYFVYLLECRDGTYYTGITKNLNKRLIQHNNGTGSKYTRSRRPVKLIDSFKVENRSIASKYEARIKKLSHNQKLKFFKEMIDWVVCETTQSI